MGYSKEEGHLSGREGPDKGPSAEQHKGSVQLPGTG